MYKYSVTVEFEDVDSYSIAHHTKIIAYLERARVHFFAENGIDLNTIDYGLVLRTISITFKIPLIMLDTVTVQIETAKISKYRFEWHYTIIKEGKTAVTAVVEQAFIDIAQKRLIPIPESAAKLLRTLEKK